MKIVLPISSSPPPSPLGLMTSTTTAGEHASSPTSGFTDVRTSTSPSKMMSTPILAGSLTIKAPSSLTISPIGSSKYSSEGGVIDGETMYSIPTPLLHPKTPRTVTSAQDTPLHRAVQKVDLHVDMLCRLLLWSLCLHFPGVYIVRSSSSFIFSLPGLTRCYSWITWRLMNSSMTTQESHPTRSLSTHKRSMDIHHL